MLMGTRAAAFVLLILALAPSAPAQQNGAAVPDRTRPVGLATIQGNALSASGSPLGGVVLRLRDARRGRIVGTTTSDQAGVFVFRGLEPGTYIVELLGRQQTILAASALLDLNAGDIITAIVKLPFRIQPYAGILGHTTMSAVLVTATAAATGVLAAQVAGEPVSPRR